MKQYKFYMGTETGKCAKDTEYEGIVFTKEQVVATIEHSRKLYNALYGTMLPIEGYSLYTIDGYWNGVQETSFVLEIMIEDLNHDAFASGIKYALLQDSVMVTVQELQVEFI